MESVNHELKGKLAVGVHQSKQDSISTQKVKQKAPLTNIKTMLKIVDTSESQWLISVIKYAVGTDAAKSLT